MLELLISIILSLGLGLSRNDSGQFIVNSAVVQKTQSASNYEQLGGDAALNSVSIVVTDDIDPK